jgi:hypothetical protein
MTRASEATADDRLLAVLAITLGALRVAIALAVGQRFGGEATIAVLMIALGIAGLTRRSA